MEEFQSRRLFFMLKICALLSLACSGLCFGQSKWNLIDPLPQTNALFSVTYGNKLFVAVGILGSILTSPDAAIWTIRNSVQNYDYLRSVTYGNGQFVVVGDREMLFGNFHGTTGVVCTSFNASAWTNVSDGTWEEFYSVIYAKNQFVLAGGIGDIPFGMILTSTDAGILTRKFIDTSSVSPLYSVTYGDSQFVAVGVGGEIVCSPDAVTWTIKKTASINSELSSVTYGDSQFVVVGSGGVIFTSPDAVTWTIRNSGTAKNLFNITYGNGQFVVVGDSGIILTSPSAKAWTVRNSGTTKLLYSVAYGDSQFVAVGDSGIILTSTADVSGIANQPKSKMSDNGRIKVKCANTSISVILPKATAANRYKVGLFTVSGKKVYVATFGAGNGVINVPALKFQAGMYYISIEGNGISRISSPIIVTR
jgi:hypothetical protein